MIPIRCAAYIDEREIPPSSGLAELTQPTPLKLVDHPIAVAFGLEHGKSFHVQSRDGWPKWRGRKPDGKRWAEAVAGGPAIAIAGLSHTNVIVLDLDAGHDVEAWRLPAVPAPADCASDLDGYVAAWRRVDTKAGRMRQHVAQAIGEPLERLRRAFPGLPFLVQSTPHGAHVIIKTHEARSVEAQHRAGLALVARMGATTFGVEVFPTPDGRMCRSPGTGRVRLLDASRTAFANAKRTADVCDLLALQPADAELLDALSASAAVGTRDAARAYTVGTSEDGKLRGAKFSRELIEHYETGIAKGQSWSAARRWAFALVVGVGLSVSDSIEAFQRLIERPNHRARQCKNLTGRKKLLGSFRSCARRYSAAVAKGDVSPRMRNARVLAIVSALHVAHAAAPVDPVRASIEETKRVRSERAARAAKVRYTRHDLGKETAPHEFIAQAAS